MLGFQRLVFLLIRFERIFVGFDFGCEFFQLKFEFKVFFELILAICLIGSIFFSLALLDFLFEKWFVFHDGFEGEFKFLILSVFQFDELVFALDLSFETFDFFLKLVGVHNLFLKFFIGLL